MNRRIDEIAADFDALTPRHFDNESAGLDLLDRLCKELHACNDPAACAVVLFRTMERLEPTEMGTPGPIVHTLEEWPGRYEALLAESVRRKPVPLTVWMVNRILNTRPPDAGVWLALLERVADHPLAGQTTREQAARSIRLQGGSI